MSIHVCFRRNSISLRLSLLREDVLRCMVGMLRCYHGDDNILLIVLECIDLAAHGCDQLRQNLSDLGLVTVIMNLLQQDSLKVHTSPSPSCIYVGGYKRRTSLRPSILFQVGGRYVGYMCFEVCVCCACFQERLS